MPQSQDVATDVWARFLGGDRGALAKVITLIESTADKDKAQKLALLSKVVGNPDSVRLAVSGPPGVGKSTFINQLGKKIIEQGFKLAVLPIDPSSTLSMGSILGDKVRMSELAHCDDVYIRPSPSRGVLGGVSLATRDVMLVVEHFGYNCVIIETVGVGQSESVARLLSDHFVLLMQPGSGDQLQAMKKGVLELADSILVNKADGEQEALARKTKDSLNALVVGHEGDKKPYVGLVSALTGAGIDNFLTHVVAHHHKLKTTGQLTIHRALQFEAFLKAAFIDELARRLALVPKIHQKLKEYTQTSAAGELSPTLRISELIEELCAKVECF